MKSCCGILVPLLLLSVPVWADESPAVPDGFPPTPKASVSVRLEEARLPKLFREIEKVAGLPLAFDTALARIQVSLEVQGVPWDRLAALLRFALGLEEVAGAAALEFRVDAAGIEITALDITQCPRPELDGNTSYSVLRFTTEDDFSSLTVKDMGEAGGFVQIRRCGEGHLDDTTASRGGGKG
jgi:hypothetical protein